MDKDNVKSILPEIEVLYKNNLQTFNYNKINNSQYY